jgi:hypothetical protein
MNAALGCHRRAGEWGWLRTQGALMSRGRAVSGAVVSDIAVSPPQVSISAASYSHKNTPPNPGIRRRGVYPFGISCEGFTLLVMETKTGIDQLH